MSMSADTLAALLAAPALAPPEGVTPNFDNPPNNNGLAWFVTTFCMVIATACLMIRAYVKLWLTRRTLNAEEILMVLAYGAYWAAAYAGFSMIFTPGYYVHQWNLRNGDLIQPLYLILVYGCAYSAVLPLLKTAILLDWCRIFVPSERRTNIFWWGCMFVIVIQIAWGIACLILLNMQCTPHEAIWEFYLPSKCYSLPKVMLTSASVQVFTDWCMVGLPHLVIWRLQMNWQKKVGISIIFGVGLLASIAACVRLSTTVTFAKETDLMFYIGPLLFWACAEMTCGFFILCVPCIPTAIKQSGLSTRVQKMLGVSSKDNSGPSASYNYNRSNPLSSHKKAKSGLDTTDTYYKMDEEESGLSLGELKVSESQERLRKWQGSQENAQITRTTEVNVSSDHNSKLSGNELLAKSIIPWNK